MSMLDSALYLASLGFHVFPLRPGTKKPMFRGWYDSATCDPDKVREIWTRYPNANIGINTTRYTNGTEWNGLGVDVDNKNGRRGSESAAAMGVLLPETFVQRTPTGGFHYLYRSVDPVANGVGSLGEGLDVRGYHGYVVGAGSMVPAGQYTIALASEVAEAPEGLLALIGKADTRERSTASVPVGINTTAALKWAEGYLLSLPVAVDGAINNSAFAAAATLRDRGLSPEDIYGVMFDHFKAALRMDEDEIWSIANNVYKYAKGAPGSAAPEIRFKELLQPAGEDSETDNSLGPADGTPIDWFNKDHAVCLVGSGCNILKRGKDSYGKPKLNMMGTSGFHDFYAGMTFTDGQGKVKSLSRAWMNSKNRATYEGLDFAPGRPLPPTYYNLWQGFAFEPQSVGDDRARRGLENIKYHILHNMALDDEVLAHRITCWVAQIYQQPQEKHPTSMVIRGQKGTGKDTILNIFGELLGVHYMVTSQAEDVTGKFNAAIEAKLLVVYNEAIWAHDHKAEGPLKDLVTGRRIRIEKKFCDPYFVDNLARIVVMGNANTLVPASTDERRWFVIDMRDIPDSEQSVHVEFCTNLRKDMEAGGYPLLLDYLLNYDITGVDLRRAPNSQGLVDQKEACLPAFQTWFRECLGAGAIVGHDVPILWPERIDKEVFRRAFRRWRKDHDISGREPSDHIIGRQINEMKMGIDGTQKRTEGKHQVNVYVLPSLGEARQKWDLFLKVVKPTIW